MDEYYKENHIHSTARVLPDSGRWVPHVIVTWADGSHEEFSDFEVKRGFATEQDAEQAGLTLAKKWIDDGKPRIR